MNKTAEIKTIENMNCFILKIKIACRDRSTEYFAWRKKALYIGMVKVECLNNVIGSKKIRSKHLKVHIFHCVSRSCSPFKINLNRAIHLLFIAIFIIISTVCSLVWSTKCQYRPTWCYESQGVGFWNGPWWYVVSV